MCRHPGNGSSLYSMEPICHCLLGSSFQNWLSLKRPPSVSPLLLLYGYCAKANQVSNDPFSWSLDSCMVSI